jgi:quinolinate synthase
MDIHESIVSLKKRHNAVILAHNYQRSDVRHIADFVGDSLELSIEASRTAADVIVFCGVRFMAETAKILSPDKTVLLPAPDAGCPMADMITAKDLTEMKQAHPGARVLCYVNTTAEVKALSDICCTSSNAASIVEHELADVPEILFIPDKFLAQNTQTSTGRRFITWPGYCPTHARILPEHVFAAKTRHPDARVMVHPECNPAVCAHADAVLSTGQMCTYAEKSDADAFIVGTEKEMCNRLAEMVPGKRFYPVSDAAVCPNMKKISLSTVYHSLNDTTRTIELSGSIIARARTAIDHMIAASTRSGS